MLSETQKRNIIEIASPFRPAYLGVFGSYARNEETPESDLDLLIEFQDTVNLFDFVGLKQDISDKLGVEVDLVSKKAINKYVLPYIEKDLIVIL